MKAKCALKIKLIGLPLTLIFNLILQLWNLWLAYLFI